LGQCIRITHLDIGYHVRRPNRECIDGGLIFVDCQSNSFMSTSEGGGRASAHDPRRDVVNRRRRARVGAPASTRRTSPMATRRQATDRGGDYGDVYDSAQGKSVPAQHLTRPGAESLPRLEDLLP
jgi:hypothetical protein